MPDHSTKFSRQCDITSSLDLSVWNAGVSLLWITYLTLAYVRVCRFSQRYKNLNFFCYMKLRYGECGYRPSERQWGCDFEKNKRRIRLLRLNKETNFLFKCAGNQYSLTTVSKCKVGWFEKRWAKIVALMDDSINMELIWMICQVRIDRQRQYYRC
jgi:hypothetical protein